MSRRHFQPASSPLPSRPRSCPAASWGTRPRPAARSTSATSASGARARDCCATSWRSSPPSRRHLRPFPPAAGARGRLVKEAQGHDPRLYNDFRDLLADTAIDAVVIATPDHWHVPIGLAAVRAGKDVYIEKPLGHTLAQNQAMLEACRKHKPHFPVWHPAAQPGDAQARRGTGAQRLHRRPAADRRLGSGRTGRRLARRDPRAGRSRLRPLHRPRADEALHARIASPPARRGSAPITPWDSSPAGARIRSTSPSGAWTPTPKGPVQFPRHRQFPTPEGAVQHLRHVGRGDQVPRRRADAFHEHRFRRADRPKYRERFQGDGTTFFGTKGWVSLSRKAAREQPGLVQAEDTAKAPSACLLQPLLRGLRGQRARPDALRYRPSRTRCAPTR